MIEWKKSSKLIPLQVAISTMERRVIQIHQKIKSEQIWMLEHPHVYTGGTSSKKSHLISTSEIPVELTSRGGSYTYHGPGQRVVYVMLDLRKQGKDVRKFVWNLEQWIIDSLDDLGIKGERRFKRVGIWICPKTNKNLDLCEKNELKIASIGLRIKNWVSYFGASINVNPNLNYFNGIVPCGNEGYGVTSIKQLGFDASLTAVDQALHNRFDSIFMTVN